MVDRLWEVVDRLWKGYHESRRCSRDTYPASYIIKYTSIRRKKNETRDQKREIGKRGRRCWTIPKLTARVYGTTPSTLEQKRARVHERGKMGRNCWILKESSGEKGSTGRNLLDHIRGKGARALGNPKLAGKRGRRCYISW